MLNVPTLTKAFVSGTYVIDKKSLRLAVLSGSQVIVLGADLDVRECLEYVKGVLDSVVVK